MCKSILKGQNVPGTDGTYHGTDGTCPRDRRDAHQGVSRQNSLCLLVFFFQLKSPGRKGKKLKAPQKARLFSLCRTPKIPGKKGKSSKEHGNSLQRKEARKSQKARKGRSGGSGVQFDVCGLGEVNSLEGQLESTSITGVIKVQSFSSVLSGPFPHSLFPSFFPLFPHLGSRKVLLPRKDGLDSLFKEVRVFKVGDPTVCDRRPLQRNAGKSPRSSV